MICAIYTFNVCDFQLRIHFEGGSSVNSIMSSRAFALLTVLCVSAASACPSSPFDGDKRPGDDGYRLVFSEDIVKYVPGRTYNRKETVKIQIAIFNHY